MHNAPHVVIIVPSVSHAIKAENVLGKAGLLCKLIPVPRHISAQCGVCVRIAQADRAAVVQVLTSAQVEIIGIYEM